ncbi:MAG: alkyldihydroxyacetonephosphate synthase [Thermoleophilaceae bacterium]|nr:alkyldihydroxyacetonephosphate synthase [Thermoleophilaceae bacterium]
MSERVRSWWGWGFEDAKPSPADVRAAAEGIVGALGFGSTDVEDPVALSAVVLPAPRVAPPDPLFSDDHRARVTHAKGCSYVDSIKAFRGVVDHPPDLVAFARSERDVERVLEWAAGANAAVIPYSGGTSVVGGVEPRVPDRFDAVVSLDVGGLDALLEVDPVSRAARIGAGAAGPRVESLLAEHGLTMRFFPQSFELSTLGGWVATRAGGHFAMGDTHAEDLVESVRAVTPVGMWDSRRLPGSGAGVSPDRMLVGSEGILGVITDAWMRVQPKPAFRASRGVRFADFLRGAEAVRELAQSGLRPANLRLVDALEAAATGAGDGSHALLVLGFESTAVEVDDLLRKGLEICGAHGGEWDEPSGSGGGGSVSAWRDAFLRMPYLRDVLMSLGVLSDTFETAITWERFPAFHEQVVDAVRAALGEPCRVTCRFTHVYPDGPAPYYTVIAPARRGDEVAQWGEMKAAASDALINAGGTITHHHAVGRDHRPWYDRQRPDVFAGALRAAKAAVDPAGMLNPGVLID